MRTSAAPIARRFGALAALAALGAAIIVVVPWAVVTPSSTAGAAGTPNISMSVSMPTQTLFGQPTAVTLTATNRTASDGYNLSFNDKLPAGAILVSATPAPPARSPTDPVGSY